MTSLNRMTVALPEATVVALVRQARHGEPLADVIGRLASTRDAAEAPISIPAKRTSGRYTVSVLGLERPCATLADALAYALTTLAELDDTFLYQLSEGRGRTRPYVAPSRDLVHPDRDDLNRKFAREIRPGLGWWISNNSSKVDVTRILKAACDVAGLEFGRDVTLVHL